MRALAAFPERRTLEIIDVPEPGPLEPGEVRVRSLEVGVCGTDREIASFRYGTPPEDSDYLIMGHECLGEVVELGPDTDASLSPGDLVVPRVRRPCARPDCYACRQGRSDYCVTGEFRERGILRQHGFACERWVERAEYLHRVPRELRPVGVLLEPLSIAEKALVVRALAQKRLPVRGGEHGADRAVVIGSGPVGLLGALALVHAGFTTHVVGRSPGPNVKSRAARALGAGYVSSQEVPIERLPETIGAPDFVYEAAGASGTAFAVLRTLAPNGVFVFTGVPGRKQPLDIEGGTLMKQLVLWNQVVLGTVNAGSDAFEKAIEDLSAAYRRSQGSVEGLVTHRHPLERGPAVMRGEVNGGIKHVLCIEDRT